MKPEHKQHLHRQCFGTRIELRFFPMKIDTINTDGVYEGKFYVRT